MPSSDANSTNYRPTLSRVQSRKLTHYFYALVAAQLRKRSPSPNTDFMKWPATRAFFKHMYEIAPIRNPGPKSHPGIVQGYKIAKDLISAGFEWDHIAKDIKIAYDRVPLPSPVEQILVDHDLRSKVLAHLDIRDLEKLQGPHAVLTNLQKWDLLMQLNDPKSKSFQDLWLMVFYLEFDQLYILMDMTADIMDRNNNITGRIQFNKNTANRHGRTLLHAVIADTLPDDEGFAFANYLLQDPLLNPGIPYKDPDHSKECTSPFSLCLFKFAVSKNPNYWDMITNILQRHPLPTLFLDSKTNEYGYKMSEVNISINDAFIVAFFPVEHVKELVSSYGFKLPPFSHVENVFNTIQDEAKSIEKSMEKEKAAIALLETQISEKIEQLRGFGVYEKRTLRMSTTRRAPKVQPKHVQKLQDEVLELTRTQNGLRATINLIYKPRKNFIGDLLDDLTENIPMVKILYK